MGIFGAVSSTAWLSSCSRAFRVPPFAALRAPACGVAFQPGQPVSSGATAQH
ncbi:hypothetical protein [Phnomibacter sp. MR]|uniref:hypothetical protein n=1 Tax=Phnomibacter sp. MR TaxID=3042318 RepID=UPI003A7F64FC